MHSFQHWIQQNQGRIQEDYFTFLRFKTIGTDPSCRSQMGLCASWLQKYLQKAGFLSRLIETKGHPLVWAEHLEAGLEAHTLCIYGHYDVQPVDPLDLWLSDPFEPEIRDDQVYARGALDDKGQIFYAILAVLAFKELGEPLPINIKFCIEGEEESGSEGLSGALPDLQNLMQADSLLVPDFDLLSENEPAISLGARGIVTMEVALKGSNSDLHSGFYGGIAYNPNRALAELLAKLWDETGRVQVPGFYDDVDDLSEEEKKIFSFSGTSEEYAKKFGIRTFGGEKGRSLMEANWLRPTIEINGLSGGYTGPGFKTVIPAQATAKLSCRLVRSQNPKKIAEEVGSFLTSRATAGMDVNIRVLSAEPAFRGIADSRLAHAVAGAYTDVMRRPCHRILAGGSVPIIAKFQEMGLLDVVGMGYGLPGDQIHAPNEHFDMNRLGKGILTVARTIQRLR
jgi:acetylornithine deacetylase/succinyl-diaminopimelate desuccinylase-like protein